MWHYPNDLKFAFADLSASFPEHPDYLEDDTTKITSDKIGTILDTLCRDARFNGVKLTAEKNFDDAAASENLRRAIYNHARSTSEECNFDHMMLYAATPDWYDMFLDDFASDEDDFVDFLVDYLELYEPEFFSPFTGSQLTHAQIVSIMDKLDTKLTANTFNYMNDGTTPRRFNPIPWDVRYTDSNRRPAWTMPLVGARRELEESPRDQVRRLSAVSEEPLAGEKRNLQSAPSCRLGLG